MYPDGVYPSMDHHGKRENSYGYCRCAAVMTEAEWS